MNCWTHWLRRGGWLLLFVILWVLVLLEFRYSSYEVVVVSENTAKILRRVPEVEITERDRELTEALLQCSEVQELVESGGAGDLSGAEAPELADAAGMYLSPVASGTVSVSVFDVEEDPAENFNFLVSWRNREKELFMVQRTETEGAVEYYKLYAREGWNGPRNVYESFDNERARETTTRRRWLSYFRDRMWETS